MLDTIYVTRHGFRSNWVTDPDTGVTTATIVSPTNIPSDPPLAAHGVEQARELAEHLATLDPKPTRIYSSPFYRCLQTVDPVAERLGLEEIRAENGIGEWYGRARFEHPSPASLELLHAFFPRLSTSYIPVVIPSTNGESVREIHDRVAYALARIIEDIDHEHAAGNPNAPKAILLCSHAATNICIGRVLMGDENRDVKTGTCSLSVYKRRSVASVPGGKPVVPLLNADGSVPAIEWRGGMGVGGGWIGVVNGDCEFLRNGEERNWWFNGEEDWDFAIQQVKSGTTGIPGAEEGVGGPGTMVKSGRLEREAMEAEAKI
ncbi:histidine phosphatase superfamily [Kalaharituber pfeilii]|nr:histidine phosphatase superfamily [Kalaharituber pfeilii]